MAQMNQMRQDVFVQGRGRFLWRRGSFGGAAGGVPEPGAVCFCMGLVPASPPVAHQHERKIGVRAGGDFIEIPRDEFAFHGQIFAVDHVEILFLSQPFDKGAPAVGGVQ